MKLLFLEVTNYPQDSTKLGYIFRVEDADTLEKDENSIDITLEGPDNKLVARVPVNIVNEARQNYNLDVVAVMFTELKRLAGL